jgi:hypothetical protein
VRVAASLTIRVAADPVFASAETTGIVGVDPTSGELALPAGLVSLSGSWPSAPTITFTLQNPAAVLRPGGAMAGTCPGPLDGQGACILGGASGGGLGGSMPFAGTIHIGALASLPASVIGAAATVSGGGAVLQGAPFTARTAAVTTTLHGFWTTARGQAPASWLTRAGNPTAVPEQVLLLVAPVHVKFPGQRLPVFVVLSLRAIPEPGAGALTLVAAGTLLGWACWPMLGLRVRGRSSRR